MAKMNENWKSIPGFPDYEISSQGTVKSHKRKEQRILKGGMVNGYRFVCLSLNGKTFVKRVAHLVLLAFIGPRPTGMVTCHNNGIKDDDRLENLRYDTQKANLQDARVHNGGTSPNASLTLEKAKDMFIYCKSHTVLEAAKKFNVKKRIVRSVIGKESYSYIGTISIKNRKAEEGEQIRELYSTGKYTYAELGKKFNLSASTICRTIKQHIRGGQ